MRQKIANTISKYGLYKISALILVALFLLPTNIFCVLDVKGLDGSWRYMINYAADMGLKFGRDIVFSYGPLGFICYSMNVKYNMLITSIVFCVLYVFLYRCFSKFVLRESTSNQQTVRAVFFVWLMIFSMREYVSYAQQKENYILFAAFMVFANIIFDVDRKKNLLLNSLLIILCFFVKFTMVLFMIPAEIFLLFSFISEKKKKESVIFAGSILGSLLSCMCFYMLYNPSIKDLFHYVSGAIEISSGYSAAMSLIEGEGATAFFPFLLLVGIGLLAVWCIWQKNNIGWFLLITDSSLFLVFKHAFVRGFSYIFYSFFFLCCLCFLLHSEKIAQCFEEMKICKYPKVFKCLKRTCIVLVIIIFINGMSYSQRIECVGKVYASNLREAQAAYVTTVPNEFVSAIPDKLIEKVGNKTIAVYPYEILDAILADLNVVHYPTYQNYCAYTANMDKWNADFFNGENVPEYMLIHHTAIDGRIVYLDTPATYRAIFANYEFVANEGSWFLLKKIKRENVQADEWGEIECVRSNDETVILSDLENYKLLRIDMDLNMIGKIVNLFYAVPEVKLNIYLNDGEVLSGRVIPDNLRNGIDLKSICGSAEDGLRRFSGVYESRVSKIEIGGAGVEFYNVKGYVSQ